MSRILNDLTQLLMLEKIEQGIFRGQSQDLGFRVLFGGQVMGQSVSAAQETVAHTHHIHSLHSYFLRPGDPSMPIVYEVENLRDGKSFSTRRVQAIQKGKAIFYMTASFQKNERGFEHQEPMPDVASPDSLASFSDFIFEHQQDIPTNLRGKFLAEKPIEVRPVDTYNWLKPQAMPAKTQMWIKANGTLPDKERIHTSMLAYASDFHFLPTALFPHGVSHWHENFQIATIDHAMWFHRPFRFDDWLIYCIESPSACNGRGFVKGTIYNRQGQLVASTAQEGVMRQHQP